MRRASALLIVVPLLLRPPPSSSPPPPSSPCYRRGLMGRLISLSPWCFSYFSTELWLNNSSGKTSPFTFPAYGPGSELVWVMLLGCEQLWAGSSPLLGCRAYRSLWRGGLGWLMVEYSILLFIYGFSSHHVANPFQRLGIIQIQSACFIHSSLAIMGK